MNRFVAVVLIFVSILFRVEADTSSGQYYSPEYASLKPSLAVVIGILTIMFLLTFLLLLYAKFCHRPREAEHINRGRNPSALISSSERFSGIDKTVIESLPFFRFSALKGSKEGLECAVCLSKFEDVEILRLLPKCKHAFHIDCIDYWLEKHSTCPLCRHRVSSEDLNLIAYSNSLRFLREESSDFELFVQREESHRGSSRFSVGSSFRKIEKSNEESLIHTKAEEESEAEAGQNAILDKHKHKIVVSEFVLKNRWSNVTSSDLLFLNSEMLNETSSGRFSSIVPNNEEVSSSKKRAVDSHCSNNEVIMKIKEEMEMKKSFENKVGTISTTNSTSNTAISTASTSRSVLSGGEQRSVSEITAFSRYNHLSTSNEDGDAKARRIRRAWLPIAKKTVQWFANRQQERSQFQQYQQRQSLDV